MIQLLAYKFIHIVNKDHERESQKGGRYYTENRKSFIRKRKQRARLHCEHSLAR